MERNILFLDFSLHNELKPVGCVYENRASVLGHLCVAQEELTARSNLHEFTKQEQGCALLYRQAGRGWDEPGLFITAAWIPLYIYLPVLMAFHFQESAQPSPQHKGDEQISAGHLTEAWYF